MILLRLRTSLALLAGVLILGLPALGFLHAVTPHGHTHAGSEHTELASWLGSVSGRKEMLGIFTDAVFLFGVAAILEVTGALALVPLVAYARRTHPDPHDDALHRGRFAYRAFR